jgi:hypothetical protein
LKIDEAKAECDRWFASIQRQKEKALALQNLARERREGKWTDEEARHKMRQIDGAGLTVYDGANLERAVRVLLKHVR